MFLTKLPIFQCLDLVDNINKSCTIKIKETTHKFSKNSSMTGEFGVNIFGSESFNTINNTNYNYINMDYAMPIIRIKRNRPYKINIENHTKYNFNFHKHGQNDGQESDGGTTFAFFGPGTNSNNLNIVGINKNNSATLFNHTHPMSVSSTFLYSGLLGLIMVTDDISDSVDKLFIYDEKYSNNIQLVYQDIDLNPDGTLNELKLYDFNWRSKYGSINGVSCINWETGDNTYVDKGDNTYVDKLYYETNKNVVKITLLNATCSFRNLYIGVCGIDKTPKYFYLVQTDQGYRNPTLINICSISIASRNAILIDLNEFPNNEAYLFFYNFDLTETPIVNNGIKIFLKINYSSQINNFDPRIFSYLGVNNKFKRILNSLCPDESAIQCFYSNYFPKNNQLNLENIIRQIRYIVFGNKPKLIEYIENNLGDFETNNNINYLNYLNKEYFYELPDISLNTPIRKIIAFYDEIKSNGATDWIEMGQNRIMIDMLTNEEKKKYDLNNNSIIPTCLFKITDNPENYINLDMIINNKLIINVYDISDTNKTNILKNITIIFESNENQLPYNITEWFELVNNQFSNTTFSINNEEYILSNILKYNWEMYEYSVNYSNTSIPPEIVNTVRVKINNLSSNFIIELKAPFGLINYFGKPLGAMYLPANNMKMSHKDVMSNKIGMNNCRHGTDSHGTDCCGTSSHGTDCCGTDCSQFATSHTLNPNDSLKQTTIVAGSSDGSIELADSNHNFTITINQQETYIGFIDGFVNDNFINMTSKLNQTELIYYCNLDDDITHPIHYHLSSTWFDNSKITNSPNVPYSNNPSSDIVYNDYNQGKYSKDIQIVAPQEKMNFYIKYVNYTNDTPPYWGYMYHCHIMSHHDMGMMGQFFVLSETIFNSKFK